MLIAMAKYELTRYSLDTAEDYIKKAINAITIYNERVQSGDVYYTYGRILEAKGETDKAYDYYYKAYWAADCVAKAMTRIALIDFQLRNALAPTGIADRTTWELLYAQYLDILQTKSLPSPIIPFPSYPDDYEIKLGEKSFLVATLQYMLNEIGIIYNTFDNLEITGVYDEITEKAVRDFQERGLLAPTGKVDRGTWDSLARIYNLSLHYIEQY